MLAALALIRTLQVKAFASIQLAPTLSAIATHDRGILDALYPRPGPDGRPPAAPLPPLRRSSITWRFHRVEELASGNFPAIWRHTAGGDP